MMLLVILMLTLKRKLPTKTTELVATIDKYMAEVESSLVSDASKATFADAKNCLE